MEQIAIILFLVGTVLFIGFGVAVGNYHQEDEDFGDLNRFNKVKVSIFTALSLLGLTFILTSCILGIIDSI
ncbi:hypothetical protein [Capnocytophaga canis]|uniref:hypothetical protein n=1 Tax=Capnocytophaga canis TaxID=1848903 RepID=UPI0037D3D97C